MSSVDPLKGEFPPELEIRFWTRLRDTLQRVLEADGALVDQYRAQLESASSYEKLLGLREDPVDVAATLAGISLTKEHLARYDEMAGQLPQKEWREHRGSTESMRSKLPQPGRQSDFTPDEWKTLLESVVIAGLAVTAADPSGLWGTFKESMANARAVIGAKQDPNATELIKAIAGEFETSEGRATARDGLWTQLSGKTPAEITAKSLEILKQATAIVGAKAPADAAAFKGWLRHISQSVNEASAENISASPLPRPRPKGAS